LKKAPHDPAPMNPELAQRCLLVADYLLARHATVRQAARAFGLSKSSVHKDMRQRLPLIAPQQAQEVAALLNYHKAVRHLRGGAATRRKFLLADRPAGKR